MDRLFDSLFLAEFTGGKEKNMDPEMVKELKRQQEAHNKQMQEMDEFFLRREETLEDAFLEKIVREVRGE